MAYETDVKRMEEIAELLRDNKTSLDESINLFEEGMQIAQRVEKELSSIERKIEMLMTSPEANDTEPTTVPFEP
jgi:exodeoxyribonuclease VII small subunit